MTSNPARLLLHTVHLLTFALLFVSGLLLFVPDLRAAVTGGYSLVVRESHRWGGVAFLVLPLLVMLRFGVRSLAPPAPAKRSLRSVWQALHTAVTAIISLVFVVTGFVMWSPDSASEALLDRSRDLHDQLTYVVAALVVLHLVEVGLATLVERFRSAGAEG